VNHLSIVLQLIVAANQSFLKPCLNNSPGGTFRQARVALVHDKNASSGLWWIVICNSKFGGNKAN